MVVNILHLYYDILNLNGEYGNVVILKKHIEDQGYEVIVDYKSIGDKIDFKQYKGVAYKIIGAAMNVHNEMNWGLSEPLYNEALHLELLDQGIANEREKQLTCFYKNHKLEKCYQMDLVVGNVVVELKSVGELNSAHRAQLFNYLRLTRKPIGLLINFGQPSLQGERYGFCEDTNECVLLDRNMDPVYP